MKYIRSKLDIIFRVIKALRRNGKFFIVVSTKNELEDCINNVEDASVDIFSNYTQYELYSFIAYLPLVDEDELILMKAIHDAEKEELIP